MRTITAKFTWTFDLSESYELYLMELNPDEMPMGPSEFAEFELEDFDFNKRAFHRMALTIENSDS